MSEMIVYHGGTEKIERPICKFVNKYLIYDGTEEL